MTVGPQNTSESRIPIAKSAVDPPLPLINDEVLRSRVREALSDVQQRPRWERVLGAPLTSVVVAGLIGAALTSYYDNQRLRTEHELIKARAASERLETQREVEISRAFETFEDLSRLLDKRLWRARRLAWAASDKATAEDLSGRRSAYRDAVSEWNESLNRNLARVERYFGQEARGELEGGISDGLRTVHTELGDSSVDPKQLSARIDDLNNRIYNFNIRLLTMVEAGHVGAYRKRE